MSNAELLQLIRDDICDLLLDNNDSEDLTLDYVDISCILNKYEWGTDGE